MIKPVGSTLDEFQPLSPAEEKLLQACRSGKAAKISAKRPTKPDLDITVRATFLRFLAIGGDEYAPMHERGVRLAGACIKGTLDFQAVKIFTNLSITNCFFDSVLVFRDARIAGSLNLTGSHVIGVRGDRMVCEGSLFLRFGFTATGVVSLLGAKIGGDLDCNRAKLGGTKGDALYADGVVVGGDVLLTKGFTATKTVRLPGAEIRGNLECSGAKLDVQSEDALFLDGIVVGGDVLLNSKFIATGAVRLLGSVIHGDLDCSDAKLDGGISDALSVERAVIKGIFFFRDLVEPVSGISLASCHVRCLADDRNGWGDRLNLDDFIYDSIVGGAPTDAKSRIEWLDKQSPECTGLGGEREFTPQPWKQLIRTLRNMGHEEDAIEIAIEREQRLRNSGHVGQTPNEWSWPRRAFYRYVALAFHWVFGELVKFGYRPMRLVGWMVLVWLLCGAGYWSAANQGVFAPSNPLVFNYPAYANCRPDYQPDSKSKKTKSKVGNWFICPELAGEYTGFSPMAYSLDLILPLVDLQQEHDWAPIIATPKSVWYEEATQFSLNYFTRWLVWFEILFGWISSLLLVAVLTGLASKDKE